MQVAGRLVHLGGQLLDEPGEVAGREVAALTSGLVLTAVGFNAAKPALSTALSMDVLLGMYAAVPGIIGLLAAACMIGYPLTEEKHAEILRQLADRDGAAPPPQPEDVVTPTPDVSFKPAE